MRGRIEEWGVGRGTPTLVSSLFFLCRRHIYFIKFNMACSMQEVRPTDENVPFLYIIYTIGL